MLNRGNEMAKQIDNALTFLSKFVAPLLFMILSFVWNIQMDVSSQKESITEFKKFHENERIDMDTIKLRLNTLTSQSSNLLNEQLKIKMLSEKTREIQIERSDEIECISEIRKTKGCGDMK